MRMLLLLVLAVSGCAYNIGFVGRQLPQGHTYIAVPVFKNQTFEPGIEVEFTNAMIREIERSGVARVVSKEKAEVVLKGVIVDLKALRDSPRTQSGFTLAEKIRLSAQINLELHRQSDRQIIWAGSVDSIRFYDAPRVLTPIVNSANALYDLSARREAIGLMAMDASTKAFDRLTENF